MACLQELLKQEMEVDRRHDEQLLALQQVGEHVTNSMVAMFALDSRVQCLSCRPSGSDASLG